MKLETAIDMLEQWCCRSVGAPIAIPGGQALTFQSRAKYSRAALHELERALDCALPLGYIRFMEAVGESTLFANPPYRGGIVMFSPAQAIEASLGLWDEEEMPGRDRFCMVGAHMSMGDHLGFALDRPAPRNFDVYCHEYPPQEYAATSDELRTWRSFDEWLIRAVRSLGEDAL